MPDNLFIGREEFSGFLKRANVDGGQVWVFQPYREDPITIWSMDQERDTGPIPASPWFKRNAIPIYKFWRAATFDWTIPVFDGSGFPVDVTMRVTATLDDPVAYIGSGLYLDIHEALKAPLAAALREALALELQEQFDLQVVPLAVHDMSLPTLRQLLPDADLSRYIQGRADFRELGVRVRAVVLLTQTSPRYESLVQTATTALNQQFLEAKQELMRAAIEQKKAYIQAETTRTITRAVREDELEYRAKLYSSVQGYYENIYPTIKSTLEKLIEQAGGVAKDGLEPAMATIFKDMVRPAVEAAVQVGLGRNSSTGIAGGDPSVGGFASSERPGREAQIKALYAAGSEEGWRLSPPLDQFLRNRGAEIVVDVGEKCKVSVRLPSNFPQAAPTLKATSDGLGVRISEVKAATDALLADMQGTGNYDLGGLVKAVTERIRPGAQTE